MEDKLLDQQLSTLRELHWPLAPGWLPDAPGFWFLAGALLCVMFSGLWRWWHHRQKPCQEAMAILNSLYAQLTLEGDLGQQRHFAEQCKVLIKRFARRLYPLEQPDTLLSQEWQDFLLKHSHLGVPPEALTDALYQPHLDIEPDHLKHWVEGWILRQRFRWR